MAMKQGTCTARNTIQNIRTYQETVSLVSSDCNKIRQKNARICPNCSSILMIFEMLLNVPSANRRRPSDELSRTCSTSCSTYKRKLPADHHQSSPQEPLIQWRTNLSNVGTEPGTLLIIFIIFRLVLYNLLINKVLASLLMV